MSEEKTNEEIKKWFKKTKEQYLEEEAYSLLTTGGLNQFIKYIEDKLDEDKS